MPDAGGGGGGDPPHALFVSVQAAAGRLLGGTRILDSTDLLA